jgi:hypothetical protein
MSDLNKSPQELQTEIEALRRERDTLQNMVLDTGGQLAASQAYSQQLLEALEKIGTWVSAMHTGRESFVTAKKALALPHDDTALKQYGAKLLRDAADRIMDGVDRAQVESMADELEGKK